MSDDRAERSSRSKGWLILALLIGLIVGCLAFSTFVVFARGERGDVGAKIDSLQGDNADPTAQRQQLRELATEFFVEFHSYGPDDLVEGKLSGYSDRVTPLATSKFEAAFDKNLQLPQSTVSQIGAVSTCEAQGSGLVTASADKAEVMVAGWVQLSYENPKDKSKLVKGDQQPLRYLVKLVRNDGKWLVDDLDQVDDNLPGFAEQGGEQAPGVPGSTQTPGAPSGSTPAPSAPKTSGATP